jgi:hypothetical protein
VNTPERSLRRHTMKRCKFWENHANVEILASYKCSKDGRFAHRVFVIFFLFFGEIMCCLEPTSWTYCISEKGSHRFIKMRARARARANHWFGFVWRKGHHIRGSLCIRLSGFLLTMRWQHTRTARALHGFRTVVEGLKRFIPGQGNTVTMYSNLTWKKKRMSKEGLQLH